MTAPNRLYFGDCLDVMREDIASESVDLIYLDPPFNSKRLYNAFMGGAQWVAFDDTWRWHEAIDDFHAVAEQPPLAGLMEGLRLMLGEGASLAYLSYMANRLVDCRRVLKPTGSIYLHCDPTMSHYLKAVMDGVFGTDRFRSEIVWRRTGTHNNARRFAPIHDVILFYTKSDSFKWNDIRRPYMRGHVEEHFVKDSRGWRTNYYGNVLTGSGIRNGESGKPWKGFDPTAKKRHWAIPRRLVEEVEEDLSKLTQHQKLDRLHELGYIRVEPRAAWPVYEHYIKPNDGQAISDIWAYQPYTEGTVFHGDSGVDADVRWLSPKDQERLGYPTQKPVNLLERIIKASSGKGDLVLDPFCGCGTTVHAAQNLGRRWIGIDICVNACKVIEQRLRGHFDTLWSEVEFVGMPKTADDAKTLASLDAFRFERWAASLVDGMEANKRQRADKGIDGWGRIPIRKGQFIDMVSQVKGGSTGPGDVQAFNGARQQAGADLGIFTCFDERVTPRMRDAAASTGRFMDAPTVQIYTVQDYFAGRVPALPKTA